MLIFSSAELMFGITCLFILSVSSVIISYYICCKEESKLHAIECHLEQLKIHQGLPVIGPATSQYFSKMSHLGYTLQEFLDNNQARFVKA